VQLRIEPLGAHDRAAFSCGNEAVDRYLRQQADQDVRGHVAAVFVLCAPGSPAIVGYYTLAAFRVLVCGEPQDRRRRAAVLLSRLAVDERHVGHGWGETLLLDALARSLQHSDQLSAPAVVADAQEDSARTFYERYGFQPLLEHGNRLYLPMKTIERVFRTE
jgi:GNAT superfamily N-acetyltransferase